MPAITFVSDQPAAKVHSSLRCSLKAMETARNCSVLWFAEVMSRHLYRQLGYSSINQYAKSELGFSKSRTWDFIRLAGQLDKLPAIREAMVADELGYTKAREIVAAVCRKGGRNKTTVHHAVPRSRGGTNRRDNLVTLCAACHRLWHERGWRAAPDAGR